MLHQQRDTTYWNLGRPKLIKISEPKAEHIICPVDEKIVIVKVYDKKTVKVISKNIITLEGVVTNCCFCGLGPDLVPDFRPCWPGLEHRWCEAKNDGMIHIIDTLEETIRTDNDKAYHIRKVNSILTQEVESIRKGEGHCFPGFWKKDGPRRETGGRGTVTTVPYCWHWDRGQDVD